MAESEKQASSHEARSVAGHAPVAAASGDRADGHFHLHQLQSSEALCGDRGAEARRRRAVDGGACTAAEGARCRRRRGRDREDGAG